MDLSCLLSVSIYDLSGDLLLSYAQPFLLAHGHLALFPFSLSDSVSCVVVGIRFMGHSLADVVWRGGD